MFKMRPMRSANSEEQGTCGEGSRLPGVVLRATTTFLGEHWERACQN